MRDNIHFFGGDPERVTLGGHSSGGCDVGLLMLSPLAKGKFAETERSMQIRMSNSVSIFKNYNWLIDSKLCVVQ